MGTAERLIEGFSWIGMGCMGLWAYCRFYEVRRGIFE